MVIIYLTNSRTHTQTLLYSRKSNLLY